MKQLATLFCLIGFSHAGFSQNLNTSTSITLPNVVAEDKDYNAIVEAEFDEEISIDMVFDKIALIESLVFTDEELQVKNQKHLKEETELVFFGNAK